MVENTAMSLHNVNTEIDRYIIWPGQVCKLVMAPPAAAADLQQFSPTPVLCTGKR